MTAPNQQPDEQPNETVNVRYMVDDVAESVAFYTDVLSGSRPSTTSHRRSPTSPVDS